MNILFIDQFRSIGGGQRSLVELLPLVRKRGWSARVALPGDGSLRTKIESGGFAVDCIPCSTYTPGKKALSDFGRFLDEVGPMTGAISRLVTAHRIDLVYVNGPRLLPAAAWVARAKSVPLVFHCHHRICQGLAVRLTGEALRWSRGRVIACCRFAGEPIEGYVAAGRFRIIYNGVAAPSWKRLARDPVKPWSIGVIGRVEPEKGQMDFVSAARILLRECGNCRFIVAGAPLFSGPEYFERVREASRDLPFEFFGWQDDIGSVFSRLDLLVVPSADIDSTPRVVIEAFSGGVPVVAFPAGGIPEVLQDNTTGFLAADASPAALAARIGSVLRVGLRPLREVAERAKATWRERYTLDRYQEEVGEAIVQACS